MKQATGLVSMAWLVLICAGSVSSFAAGQQADPPPPVVGQSLDRLEVAGKVMTVMWTRRTDRFTLQVVFPRPFSVRAVARAEGRQQQELEQVQVFRPAGDLRRPTADVQAWFLRADGTHIPATRRLVLAPERGVRTDASEIMFTLPLDAGREAVAVALMVDGQYQIERLDPAVSGRGS